MKNKFFSLVALVGIAVAAFAFKAQPTKVFGTLFKLNTLSTPHDPAAYSPYTGNFSECVNQSKVCVIDVPAADIYPASDPTYPSLPKVDIQNPLITTELQDDINNALGTTGTNPTSVNGRVIYERN